MEFFSTIRAKLTDGRLDANLIVFYGFAVITVVVALIVRRLLAHSGARMSRLTGSEWVDQTGAEAISHIRKLVNWMSVSTVLIILLTGIGYHWSGKDIRNDLGGWFQDFSAQDWLRLALRSVATVLLVFVARLTVWGVRKGRTSLESHAARWIGGPNNEEVVGRWFVLFERFCVAAVRLAALWIAGHVVGLGEIADASVGFVLRLLSIVVLVRLLILGCRVLLNTSGELGDQHLANGAFQHYWERIHRLFPFGQYCFEAALYISAASMFVSELHFITMVADVGPYIVKCIEILFGTRVVIALLQVFLNEAFGLYDESRPLDPTGRTLVPLLHSLCQYVLYFGSVVLMLGVFGLSPMPLLTGAGILGLAVGLGAQSLVADVVSGFFILFENQYLVGDYVQIGDAVGTIESVGIRLTQIRDGHGKLFIIPNGQIKVVVSYSKGYINAVVDIRVPAGNDVEAMFRSMSEAGRRLRQSRQEVLADTVVQGLIDLGNSDMTIRAVTKVKAGTHGQMQSEYRLLLKEILAEATVVTRPALAA